MNREQMCKEFAELNGGDWQEEGSGKYMDNPTYQHPEEVLEVMDKREDAKLFYAKLMYAGDNVEAIDDDGYIDRDYITEKDKLLITAYKWSMEHKKVKK